MLAFCRQSLQPTSGTVGNPGPKCKIARRQRIGRDQYPTGLRREASPETGYRGRKHYPLRFVRHRTLIPPEILTVVIRCHHIIVAVGMSRQPGGSLHRLFTMVGGQVEQILENPAATDSGIRLEIVIRIRYRWCQRWHHSGIEPWRRLPVHVQIGSSLKRGRWRFSFFRALFLYVRAGSTRIT